MANIATCYDEVAFVTYHDLFKSITGPSPSIQLLANTQDQHSALSLFHEACVYDQRSRSLFITSNQLSNENDQPNPSTSNKHIRLFRIYDIASSAPGGEGSTALSKIEEVALPGLAQAMLNGGVNYGTDSILFCAQGTCNFEDPSGLLLLHFSSGPAPNYAIESFVTSFHGIPFNSVNDVVVHPLDKSVWFTDPCYGYHQGIRPPPQLPNQIYRYDPRKNSFRVLADDFVRPNGICFSPDLQTLYVTDTGAIHGSPDVPIDLTGRSHIYAFDIIWYSNSDGSAAIATSTETKSEAEPFLVNRRLFAYAPGRFPDGIKCDTAGNVYAGCGDGIAVWNPLGIHLGSVKIEGGVSNFCFGEKGTLYACNETRLWKIHLNVDKVEGALLGMIYSTLNTHDATQEPRQRSTL